MTKDFCLKKNALVFINKYFINEYLLVLVFLLLKMHNKNNFFNEIFNFYKNRTKFLQKFFKYNLLQYSNKIITFKYNFFKAKKQKVSYRYESVFAYTRIFFSFFIIRDNY